ncbi:MAG: hypothetical protein WCF20_14625 [Methylovirgula sp.]
MKDQLLALTRQQVVDLMALQKSIKAAPADRIRQKPLLSTGGAIARQWFDVIKPALDKAAFSPATTSAFSKRFEDLLLMSRGQPMKNAYIRVINENLAAYKTEIIHQIEIGSFSSSTGLSITPYVEGLPSDEGEFLDEAQRCLSVNALRGCIVLGWCATISRIHNKIADIGFARFNRATEEMAAKTVGRFKPFNKKFSVESVSELQRVFDTELLWVLEYMTLIDSNQHQRLRHCFEFRNNSAHPGLAPITGENLYSFFSDITQIVLKNEKFAIAEKK